LSPLRLIIADDHALFRQGLRSLLVLEGLEVVAEVDQAGSLKDTLAANACDVLLLDLQMDRSDGSFLAIVSREPLRIRL
jgi:two-component system, NarL family, response regulator LiaR